MGNALWAISDVHVGHRKNREALERIAPRPNDWLILGGDLGETLDHLRWTFATLGPRFQKLLWVPGNHELWSLEGDTGGRGVARYEAMVRLCREHGVLTPEDPYPMWEGEGGRHRICPLFTLYDYTFRPDYIPVEGAVEWAAESGILCADEHYLAPDPYPTRSAWCAARCELTERRLADLPSDVPLVLIDHFPMHRSMVTVPRIPRFSIWCGSRRTEAWLERFDVAVVVYGHTHVRATRWLDGVRHEEVSFGYPRQRDEEAPADEFLRPILPGPPAPRSDLFYRGRGVEIPAYSFYR